MEALSDGLLPMPNAAEIRVLALMRRTMTKTNGETSPAVKVFDGTVKVLWGMDAMTAIQSALNPQRESPLDLDEPSSGGKVMEPGMVCLSLDYRIVRLRDTGRATQGEIQQLARATPQAKKQFLAKREQLPPGTF